MSSFQIFTPAEIISLRKGGNILRECLEHVSALVRPGVTTGQLDHAAEECIRAHGGEPAFKGYKGYPATLCTSVNEECVHGIPGNRILNDGDSISLDCGVLFEGLYTDACITVPVGEIAKDTQRLLSVTEKALQEALKVVRAGAHIGDISSVVQRTVEAEGCVPVRALTGHGLGRDLHQFPDVPNFGTVGTGPEIPLHTILAIEPIVSLGSHQVREGGDGWTLVIVDGASSAHFEHTVLVTEEGCEVLA